MLQKVLLRINISIFLNFKIHFKNICEQRASMHSTFNLKPQRLRMQFYRTNTVDYIAYN